MKKYIFVTIFSIFLVLFTGCASNNPIKYEDTIIKEKDSELFISKTWKDENWFKKKKEKEQISFISFKKAIEDVSLFAINNNKNFMIVNEEINNSVGFPINNYTNLKNYCFNTNRPNNGIKITCDSMKQVDRGTVIIKFVLVDEMDYRFNYYNPKEVLEELKNEK